MFKWLFKEKKHKHDWIPLKTPFVVNGKVYVIECCNCGTYQYVRVPSEKTRREIESQN